MQLNTEETRETSRIMWTESGIECHKLGADCENCPIHKMLGRHKNGPNKCYQAESNENLLKKGIFPTGKGKVKPILVDGKKVEPFKVSIENAPLLRAEIVKIVQEFKRPTMQMILDRLNETEFLGFKGWSRDKINRQVTRMRDGGVLKHAGFINCPTGRKMCLAVEDASKLSELIVQPTEKRVGIEFGNQQPDWRVKA